MRRGGGLLAPYAKGYRHIGVDLTESALRIARRHGVEPVRGDAARLAVQPADDQAEALHSLWSEIAVDDGAAHPAFVRRALSLAALWEREREGPDEGFTLRHHIVAVDGTTAVVRVEVDYASERSGRWRDLWVLRFADDGRCAAFEEWPFAPDQADGH